ncbi:hypothetical protein ACJJTC_003404 [Scirpophaga incertulas]
MNYQQYKKPSVKDAENVSDDELPGPKPAELPADTEVVSEDELPAKEKESKESRKRKTNEERDGYDPGSPTSEGESSSKKQAVAKNGESKPIPAEKRLSIDEKPKKKTLPELDKYWKVVNDDPTDFTGWTYLLQYVDQESEVEAAREAYDAFLSHYPYCYGYWRKYADYEKRKGSKKKCLEVLERGLKAIPLSVDLWIHYLNHIKATRTEDHIFIRSQYERAIEACGLEFRSDRLWESYIKWEAENGSALNVTNIYDRLLATPTLGYTSHFDNFQEHVMSEPVTGVVAQSELVRLRGEVRDAAGSQPQLDLPPGEDEPGDHVASEEEAQAIKERIIAAQGIKRPYFHVKPLERCQLKKLEVVLRVGETARSFKRALVTAREMFDRVRALRRILDAFDQIPRGKVPELHLHWAHFEEAHGNTARAADILDRLEKACPGLLQIQYRRVNLERRRGDYDKCVQLYESYLSGAKNKAVASALAVKYARFLFHRLDLAVHTPGIKFEELEELAMSYERQEGAEAEASAALAWRRRELAEELGDAAAARAAHLHARQPGAPPAQARAQGQARPAAAAQVPAQPPAHHTHTHPRYPPPRSLALAWRRRELAEERGDAAAGARRAPARAAPWRAHLRKRARKDKHDPPPPPSWPRSGATPRPRAPAHLHARHLARHLRKRARKDKHDPPPPPRYQPSHLHTTRTPIPATLPPLPGASVAPPRAGRGSGATPRPRAPRTCTRGTWRATCASARARTSTTRRRRPGTSPATCTPHAHPSPLPSPRSLALAWRRRELAEERGDAAGRARRAPARAAPGAPPAQARAQGQARPAAAAQVPAQPPATTRTPIPATLPPLPGASVAPPRAGRGAGATPRPRAPRTCTRGTWRATCASARARTSTTRRPPPRYPAQPPAHHNAHPSPLPSPRSLALAWRRRELAEERGDAAAARAAHLHARHLARHLRKRARKDKHDPPPPPSWPRSGADAAAARAAHLHARHLARHPAQARAQGQARPAARRPGTSPATCTPHAHPSPLPSPRSLALAWRRRELAEERGDAAAARRRALHARHLARHLRKRARKDKARPAAAAQRGAAASWPRSGATPRPRAPRNLHARHLARHLRKRARKDKHDPPPPPRYQPSHLHTTRTPIPATLPPLPGASVAPPRAGRGAGRRRGRARRAPARAAPGAPPAQARAQGQARPAAAAQLDSRRD